ncbi:MAG TPA: hypothetical protein VEZ90_15065 [Blastocatellia bacterium]|nr:hypothetical protein [Blastocatellia bacterium]
MEARRANESQKGGFPDTRLTALAAISSSDERVRAQGLETLAAAYWMPIYKYIRLKWNKPPDAAEDLTQSFFAEALEKRFFEKYDPSKARFRTFLRVCLDGFIANQQKSAGRLKRGGGLQIDTLDFQGAEQQLSNARVAIPSSMDDFFEREWIRCLFSLAVRSLQQQFTRSGKDVHFQLFQRYSVDRSEGAEWLTYAELAAEFSLPVTTVTNYLAAARRDFKRVLLEKLRDLTVNDEEFRREARSLFGQDR